MPELSAGTIELFLFLIVPGFVGLKVYDLLMPGDQRNFADSIVELVSYSMINLGIMSWLILWASGSWEAYPWRFYLAVVAVVFASPTALAIAWYNVHGRLARRGLVLDPMPTAWDHLFSKKRTLWVLVHLNNGKKFGGFYGKDSYATTYPTEESLYLEEVWRVDGNGRFKKRIERTSGMWVKGSECRIVEFFKTEEVAGE